MSEIQKTTNQLQRSDTQFKSLIPSITGLTATQKAILSFYDEPKIKTLNIVDFDQEIEKSILEAYITKGFTSNATDVKHYAVSVCKFVKLEKKHFTVKDVKTAIGLGARGDFKKDNDLNVISPEMLITWIRRYDEQVRKDAIHALQKQIEKEEEKHQEEKRIKGENDLKLSICGYYAEYLSGKSLLEIFSSFAYPENAIANIYNFLDRLELIEIDKEFKWLLYNESKKELQREEVEKQEKINQIESQTGFRLSQVIESESSFETRIITRSKCNALKEQFDIWKGNGIKSLSKILEEIK